MEPARRHSASQLWAEVEPATAFHFPGFSGSSPSPGCLSRVYFEPYGLTGVPVGLLPQELWPVELPSDGWGLGGLGQTRQRRRAFKSFLFQLSRVHMIKWDSRVLNKKEKKQKKKQNKIKGKKGGREDSNSQLVIPGPAILRSLGQHSHCANN